MTNDLAQILRENEPTICEALAEQVERFGCASALAGPDARKELVGAMLKVASHADPCFAGDWAAKNADVLGNVSHMLAALGCLERVVRFFVIKQLEQKRALLTALNQLGETVDVFRRYAAEAGGKEKLKEAEAALEESRARKTAILESSLDPIITIDHRGMITEFNRAAEQVFGRSRNEVLGTQPSEILFPAAKIAGYQNRIDRYLDAGEGSLLSKRNEVVAVRSSGLPFEAELTMTINQEHGKPVLTFFVRDISRRKKAEEEQRRYAHELEQSNRELEQFAYVASHDLQEPLRKIRTFGDRLMTSYGESLDQTGLECLARMQNAAERMQSLIKGLLTLSRVTTRAAEFTKVDLAKVVQEVVSDLEVKIEKTNARIEIGKLPVIQADPLQIRQLLQNLIGNALKFHRAEEPPVVEIEARFVNNRKNRSLQTSPKDEQCRLVVRDNGIGFDEKYLDRIFDVFQRLHPRDVHEGTGIGLAICRKIVERHGGTITAESAPEQGAKFIVDLPVAQDADQNKR